MTTVRKAWRWFYLLPATALLAALVFPTSAEQQGPYLQKASLSQSKTLRLTTPKAVRVLATVGAGGKVSAARAFGGDRRARLAALSAVRTWKFEPSPRKSQVKINIERSLER